VINRNINLMLNGFKYEVTQNFETGELKVLSFGKYTPLNKVSDYARAEASKLVSGPVGLPILEARRAACEGCEGCDKKAEGEWYCDKCGCPKWDRSRLQVKWEMPAATCPLGKWPEVR